MGGRHCRGCGSRGSAYPASVRWRMKRKILSFIILAACLMLFCMPCFAEAGADDIALIDTYGVLSYDEYCEVSAMASDTAKKIEAAVGIIFTDLSLSQKQLMERADEVFDASCDIDGDAIILAVDVSSRQYYIRQIGKMNSLKSSAMDNIENAALKGLKKSDWYAAATGFIESIAENMYFSSPDDGDYSDGDYDDPKADIVKKEVIIICVSIVISLIATGIMAAGMNNAKPGRAAANYIKKDSFKLGEQTDMYLYSTVTKVKIETENRSSGGGGGGGGGSRGGRGGSF